MQKKFLKTANNAPIISGCSCMQTGAKMSCTMCINVFLLSVHNITREKYLARPAQITSSCSRSRVQYPTRHAICHFRDELFQAIYHLNLMKI